ncbi:MAG: toxic anion resistance protein [Bacilli bacterium]
MNHDDLLDELLNEPLAKENPQQTKTPSIVKEADQPPTLFVRLPPELQSKAKEIAKNISETDNNALLQYGVRAQSELMKFSDAVLQHVRTKDTERVTQSIQKLLDKIYESNPEELDEASKPGFFKKLFGSLQKRAEEIFSKYDRLNVEIDIISDELDKHRSNLHKDVIMLETFYDKNKSYFAALNVYIAAGELKLEELRTDVYPALEKRANTSQDEMVYQELKDLHEFIIRLEKRVHDLKLSRQIAIQTAPQIRLIQGTNQALMEKIQSSILNTIPLWKNQIVIALAMNRQQKAIQAQRRVAETTNELLLRNSEKLKLNTISATRENERAMVEIDTLKTVQANLITTIQETLAIQEEGRVKRREAERELHAMEEEMKQALLNTFSKDRNGYS